MAFRGFTYLLEQSARTDTRNKLKIFTEETIFKLKKLVNYLGLSSSHKNKPESGKQLTRKKVKTNYAR